MPVNCPACQAVGVEVHRYLQPTGFAVDIRDTVDNNLDASVYVEPRSPWVSARTPWSPLPHPALGKMRHDPEGSVFSYSDASSRYGYAICLRCGRAAAEVGRASEGISHKLPVPHRKLRSGRVAENNAQCPGSDQQWAMQRNVWLGGETQTDVFELQLRHPDTQRAWSEGAAMALGAALRQALARTIGLATEEIGWGADNLEGQAVVYLYDRADGGAGYCGEVPSRIGDLLRVARGILECPRKCDSCCHGCLLDHDTQFLSDKFDRRAALAMLDDVFMQAMTLPANFRAFGETTELEERSGVSAVNQELRRADLRRVRLYLSGTEGEWNVAEWPLWHSLLAVRNSTPGIELELCVDAEQFHGLPWSVKHAWASKAEIVGVRIRAIPSDRMVENSARLLLESEWSMGSLRIAAYGQRTQCPNEEWGGFSGDQEEGIRPPMVRIRTAVPLSEIDGEVVDGAGPPPLQGQPIALCSIKGLEGSVATCASGFWTQVFDASPRLKKLLVNPPRRITYEDRYLHSPLYVRVLFESLRKISEPWGGVRPELAIHVMRPEEKQRNDDRFRGQGGRFISDWQSSDDLSALLVGLFDAQFYCGVTAARKEAVSHARHLTFEWGNGHAKLHLDSGIGFFNLITQSNFRFDLTVEDQIRQVIITPLKVRQRENSVPVYVYT
jgi:hypothetical protein